MPTSLKRFSRCVKGLQDKGTSKGKAYKICSKKEEFKRLGDIHSVGLLKESTNKDLINESQNKNQNDKGNNMNFKTRLLEEGFQDKFDSAINKTKEFATQNPITSALASGVGAGALYNYLGDGADNLEAERTQDVVDFVDKDARNAIAMKDLPSEEEYTKYADHKTYADDKDKGMFWARNTQDGYPFTSDAEHKAMVDSIEDRDTRFADGKVLGRPLNYEAGPAAGYEELKSSLVKDGRNMSPADVMQGIQGNAGLQNELSNKVSSMNNSERDSYLKTGAIGGALGAGAGFAKRKMDEKNKGL